MDDIEILNTIPQHESLSSLAIIGIIITAICALVVIVCIAVDIHDELSGQLAGIALALAIIPIISGIIWMNDRDVTPVRYEVLIPDNVNYIEFTQQYEVIEQRGEIYVIQERQSQEN